MISRIGTRIWLLWSDRRAQDLVEYSLMAGFVAVAAAAIFPPGIVENFDAILEKVNSQLLGASTQG